MVGTKYEGLRPKVQVEDLRSGRFRFNYTFGSYPVRLVEVGSLPIVRVNDGDENPCFGEDGSCLDELLENAYRAYENSLRTPW